MPLTRREAAVISAYTGVLTGPFNDMHQYAEEIMERPVWSHEFGSKDFADELARRAKPDFIALAEAVWELP